MSVNGYISIEITADAKYGNEADRWANMKCYEVSSKDGLVRITDEGDTGYFDRALGYFAEEVSDLEIPASDWKAEIRYSCEEGACEDGGNIHVTIEDGKIASFKESRIEMVEAEPWVRFEIPEPPEPKQESETGFRCPKCGQTEEFDAFTVVLSGRTHITADGWDYTTYPADVELHPSSRMECCKCHHVQHQAFFMEEE